MTAKVNITEDDLVSAAHACARRVTETESWPRGRSMISILARTLDDGMRKMTVIHRGHSLWLGSDGRLWYVFSHNLVFTALPVVTRQELNTVNSYRQGNIEAKLPDGLHDYDILGMVLLEAQIAEQKDRAEFLKNLNLTVESLQHSASKKRARKNARLERKFRRTKKR